MARGLGDDGAIKKASVEMTRIYFEGELGANLKVKLDKRQTHYLARVLRFKPGESFGIFNAAHGEWRALYFPGECVCLERIKPPRPSPRLWLAFAPIKRDGLGFLIEKATELGVSDLLPLMTARTNSGRINLERVRENAVEAARQCERLDVPTVHPPLPLADFLAELPKGINWRAAIERSPSPTPAAIVKPCGFVVGPEGGWSAAEKELLTQKVTPLSLGENVLRAETAAIACLSLALR